jgi:hypothetical protein
VKHQKLITQADRVGQVQITFTNKPLIAWGGVCTLVAKFLEQIQLREWVLAHVPIAETSPNAKGIYPISCDTASFGGIEISLCT